jgi:hypothetical protein
MVSKDFTVGSLVAKEVVAFFHRAGDETRRRSSNHKAFGAIKRPSRLAIHDTRCSNTGDCFAIASEGQQSNVPFSSN